MSAEIVQFVPKANPNRDTPSAPVVIDGYAFRSMPDATYADTAPCEMSFPFVAPDGDCA